MRAERKLANVKAALEIPLQQTTLCFLVRENRVLLAMKKRGFAMGKWNGAGGKMNSQDQSVESAAIRETIEEIGVIPKSPRWVATLNFFHLSIPEANQQVIVFLSGEWEGDPAESEEMAPRWFDTTGTPYDDMWEDDRYWLPRVLNGEMLEADFLFDENQVLLEHEIRVIRPAVDIF